MGEAGARALASLARDPNPLVRDTVIADLANMGGPTAVALVARALSDPDRRVRRTATASLQLLERRRSG